MTRLQISLVQSSFEKLKPIAGEAGVLFYSRLFNVDPSLRRLFHTPTAEQAQKLMQVLGVAVAALDRIEQLVPVLEEMGSRHAGYGVRDEHYETVGACLLWTLAQGLGVDFTPAVCDAWLAAYELLSAPMRRGALAVSV